MAAQLATESCCGLLALDSGWTPQDGQGNHGEQVGESQAHAEFRQKMIYCIDLSLCFSWKFKMIFTAKHGDLIGKILWGVDGISWDSHTTFISEYIPMLSPLYPCIYFPLSFFGLLPKTHLQEKTP